MSKTRDRRFRPAWQALEDRIVAAGYPDSPPNLSFNEGTGSKPNDTTIYSSVGCYVNLVITPAV